MLTKYDEFLCHQIETTFDHVVTSAREWTERIIVHIHDTTGRFYLCHGFGVYPNRNVIDTFALLTVDQKVQYNVRASRELRPQPDEVKVGPFSYEIIEPWKKLRCRLEDNPYGLSYDVEVEGTMPGSEEDAQFHRLKGRMVENMRRYNQVGRGSGWVRFDGDTIVLDKKTCCVERDHSWGVRWGASVSEHEEPTDVPIGHFHSWGVIQFEKWGACYIRRELWDGTPYVSSGAIFYRYGSGKDEVRIASIDHDFKFRPDMRKLTSGRITLSARDGSKKEISFKPMTYVCLRPAGYFGYRDFVHGQWKGPQWIDGFKLDLTDPQILREVSFFDEEACELRCGDEIGYGIIEQVISGKYPKYGFEGY